jgi:acetyl-CoA carboxylase biotin carboxyl carrier protein
MRELFIRKLIKMVEQSDIDSLEVKSWGRRVRIEKNRGAPNGDRPAAAPVAAPSQGVDLPAPKPVPSMEAPAQPAAPAEVHHEINSPMVGTFYRAPAPDAKPYVEVGDRVQVGQIVCIVEAMKLMNEIQVDVNGTVAAILTENGQPVEYGQSLFHIKVD